MKQQSQRKRLVWIFASVALIILGVVSVKTWSVPKKEEPVNVRVGYLNITASLPLFIAEEEGYFGEEGVKVETSVLSTSNQLVDAIIADNIDSFPEASAVPVFAAEAQSPGRLKIFSVSSITRDQPFDSIIVPAGSPVTDLDGLKGKKVGVFPGSTAQKLLKRFLDDKGVDTSSIQFVAVPPPSQLQALKAGAVDALHSYEPISTLGVKSGEFSRIFGSVYAEMLDRNPQGVAAISTKFLTKNPDTAKRFLRAMERAEELMRDNPSRARSIMAKRLNLSEEISRDVALLPMLPLREIDATVLQKYIDMLHQLQELQTLVTAESIILSEHDKQR